VLYIYIDDENRIRKTEKKHSFSPAAAARGILAATIKYQLKVLNNLFIHVVNSGAFRFGFSLLSAAART